MAAAWFSEPGKVRAAVGRQQVITGRDVARNEGGFWGALGVEHSLQSSGVLESTEPVPLADGAARPKDGGAGGEVEEETPRRCSPRCWRRWQAGLVNTPAR